MLARFYAPLSKVEELDDGTLKISGVASSETQDEAGETITAKAMQAALPGFFKHGTGALREMHQLSAAGTVDDAETEDSVTRVTATVVDESAIKKIKAGVYKGLSVGGKVLARDPLNKKIITGISLAEISLVDRPCNPDATFDVWKADGAIAEESEVAVADIKEAVVEPVVEALAEKSAEPEPIDPVAKANAALDALAAAVAAVAAVEPVEKGLYAVGRFAEVLEAISYLMKSAEYEAESEGDESKVPASLKSWLADGIAIFKAMSTEEADELIAPVKAKKAAEADDLAKAAKEAADAESDAGAALATVALTVERDGLAKALGDVAGRIDPLVKVVEALSKRLADVESQPVPSKTAGPGAAHASVSKEADAAGPAAVSKSAGPSSDDLVKALASMSEEDRTLLLIKAQHQLPQTYTLR